MTEREQCRATQSGNRCTRAAAHNVPGKQPVHRSGNRAWKDTSINAVPHNKNLEN